MDERKKKWDNKIKFKKKGGYIHQEVKKERNRMKGR